MIRPVHPVALVVLTLCMIYPGVALLYQGVYPFVAGEPFSLVNQQGPWLELAARLGITPLVPLGLKALIGLAWVGGVLGLWAGDGRAVPLALVGAAGSLLIPGAPMVMGALGLVCLLRFRERGDRIPA